MSLLIMRDMEEIISRARRQPDDRQSVERYLELMLKEAFNKGKNETLERMENDGYHSA